MGTLKKIVGPNLLHASYGFKLWILSGINWGFVQGKQDIVVVSSVNILH